MPTNSDKWYVGMLPVSKAFMGETQVYPVDDGGGDAFPTALTYSVSAVSGVGAQQLPFFYEGRPVLLSNESNTRYHIWETVDGLPVGDSFSIPYQSSADIPELENANPSVFNQNSGYRTEVQEFIDANTISRTNSAPWNAVANYELMGEVISTNWGTANDNFNTRWTGPENSWAPGNYCYFMIGSSLKNNNWYNSTFDIGRGKGYGTWIFISDAPLFSFHDIRGAEYRFLLDQWVALNEITREEADISWRNHG